MNGRERGFFTDGALGGSNTLQNVFETIIAGGGAEVAVATGGEARASLPVLQPGLSFSRHNSCNAQIRGRSWSPEEREGGGAKGAEND